MFQHPGASARMGWVLRLEVPLCKLPPVPTDCKGVCISHRSRWRPLLSGPRTESALPVCSQVEVAASQVGQGRWWCSQGSRAWGAVGACLSGSLPGTTARRPPCACLPSSGRGSCVCALGCIHELLSHQDCPRVKAPSGPHLSEILFSAAHRAQALVSIIHSCIYWWLLCARPCFQQ